MSEVHIETERLRRVEEGVARLETKFDAILPHLATREMVADLRTALSRVETELPHLATKSELANVEIRLIKWMIGTGVVGVLALSAQLWGAVQLLLRLVPK